MTSKQNEVGKFGLTPTTVCDTRELLRAERAVQRGRDCELALLPGSPPGERLPCTLGSRLQMLACGLRS